MSSKVDIGTPYRGTGADAGKKLFLPDHYKFDSIDEMLEFIKQQPLAQLLTTKDNNINATATPLIHVGKPGELLFKGHIAKRNPQSELITKGEEALALFHGPHSYVSPRWFKVTNTVPTWNYLSVQLRGYFQVITEPEEVFDVLKITIKHMENQFSGIPWVLETAPQELVERLATMIVAFKFIGTSIEGIKRLSQDKDVTDIRSIEQNLLKCEQSGSKDIAALMQQYCLYD